MIICLCGEKSSATPKKIERAFLISSWIIFPLPLLSTWKFQNCAVLRNVPCKFNQREIQKAVTCKHHTCTMAQLYGAEVALEAGAPLPARNPTAVLLGRLQCTVGSEVLFVLQQLLFRLTDCRETDWILLVPLCSTLWKSLLSQDLCKQTQVCFNLGYQMCSLVSQFARVILVNWAANSVSFSKLYFS